MMIIFMLNLLLSGVKRIIVVSGGRRQFVAPRNVVAIAEYVTRGTTPQLWGHFR